MEHGNFSLVSPEGGEGGEGVNVKQRLENPLILRGPYGPIGCGTDEGFNYKQTTAGAVNEDAVVVSPARNSFAVIDGMGSYGQGNIAAAIMGQTLLEGFRKSTPLADIQQNAHNRMRQKGLVEDGACYVAARIRRNILEIAQAGDVRLIVINRRGAVRFETTDEHLLWPNRHAVSNAVSGWRAGETTTYLEEISPGDRIVAASDGLFANFESAKVAQLIQGKGVPEAFASLEQATRQAMTSHTGKPDNRSLFIYDIEHL